ncbi:MAG: response regulator [Candidatus Omnitrophica bacterium]|nr:response regulator [Candidatus Omnitrophota bacterium]MDE2009219.1 response regulator [Candidatus Omnitrophota bacterium]MDE2213740.1 response regulator [Candidatus Omnitrophota bacterium]MDE2230685.1 response regulator [Candidatus Omnitrophota bacterium]
MLKLLLIDDDEELCAELKELLEAEGFEVDVALDGLRGLGSLKAGVYQILILDLRLPGINGYGVLKGIVGMSYRPKVLVLSGRPLGDPLLSVEGVSTDEEERVLNLADIVINKPFMVENFVGRVKQLALLVEKGQ